MGTLKTTLKVESTDLFPTPVSFTTVNNNGVNGTFSGFNTLVVGTAGTQLNIAQLDTPAYVYAQAPTTNGTAIYLQEDATSVTFSVLAPGDVIFFSFGTTAGTPSANLVALTSGGTASLNYFIGEKA